MGILGGFPGDNYLYMFSKLTTLRDRLLAIKVPHLPAINKAGWAKPQGITCFELRQNNLEWTSLRQDKNQIEVTDHQQSILESLTVPFDVNDAAVPSAIKQKCGSAITGPIGWAVPASTALLKVVDLPSTDPAEIRGMVDLQADKFSPFPIEQVAISFEIIQQLDSTSRVLIALTRLEQITNLGTMFAKAGFYTKHVDIDILGWWYLLKENGKVPNTGRHVIFVTRGNEWQLLATNDGVPIAFRSIVINPDQSAEAIAARLSDEVLQTIISMEVDWGAAETTFSLWCAEEPPAQILAGLNAAGVPLNGFQKLSDLPPLTEGLARRFCSLNDRSLNLAPPKWAEDENNKQARRTVLTASIFFVAVWLSLVVVFLVFFNLQMNKTEKIRNNAAQLESSAREVRQIKSKVLTLEQYADRSHSALECLREITSLLPKGVVLTSYVYKKANQINVRGSAESEEPIYNLIQAMGKSPLFKEVKASGITSKDMGGGKIKTEFTLQIHLPGGET